MPGKEQSSRSTGELEPRGLCYKTHFSPASLRPAPPENCVEHYHSSPGLTPHPTLELPRGQQLEGSACPPRCPVPATAPSAAGLVRSIPSSLHAPSGAPSLSSRPLTRPCGTISPSFSGILSGPHPQHVHPPSRQSLSPASTTCYVRLAESQFMSARGRIGRHRFQQPVGHDTPRPPVSAFL